MQTILSRLLARPPLRATALATLLLASAATGLNAAPQISIAYNGIEVVLTWPGQAILQTAFTVLGPWTNVASASSPYMVLPIEMQQFFRLLTDEASRMDVSPPQKPFGFPGAGGGGGCAPTPGPPFLHLFSGEAHYTAVDLRIPGRGLDFIWVRTYRSRFGPNSAQGNNWDFSYNIRIEFQNQNVAVFDGNARQDSYEPQGDGTFAASQFFNEGAFDLNGVFTLKFPDTGTWRFLPLDGSPARGKISAITDRNGNALTFGYDDHGKLTNITDTLDRNIRVNYDADGFISAVTDFMGRQVSYTHYGTNEMGGGPGDLKSATSPVVVGTPNGNDFPSGKTTTFTYTIGYTNGDQLNHNLLTVTDPKGQVFLRNIYSDTLNNADFGFDKVAQQSWGNSNEIITTTYVFQPAAMNIFALSKAIVNDRVGNVTESFYDASNRIVLHRVFTGRAVPGLPVTDTLNRPSGPLRTNDPAYFETRYEWNDDARPARITHPNGNITTNIYELELNPAGPRRSRGNLRTRRLLPGPLGGDQAEIVEHFEYDTTLAGCCSFNFITKHTDARGNVTSHKYDQRGNRTNTIHRIPSIIEDYEYNAFGQMTAHLLPDNGSGHRRRDEFTHYDSGPQKGYLRQGIVNADGVALATTYEYDAVGNVVRMIDPRGYDTLRTVNALNQVVRELSREVTDGSGLRYEKLTWYDANHNVARIDTENRDEQGVLQTNTHFSTIYEYEILNRRSRLIEEKGQVNLSASVLSLAGIPPGEQPQFIVREYGYDANRNRTLVRLGEATAERQTNNLVQILYDERNLRFREISAPGDPDRSTTQFDYDLNGNLIRTLQSLEDAPRSTLYAYDGFNRRISATDALGNATTNSYDANGNLLSQRTDGELIDVPGSAANVRLSETMYQYDAMDRRIRSDRAFFDTQSGVPISDGAATTHWTYSANSQLLAVTNDNVHATTYVYDTANRPRVVRDARTNATTVAYDANSNLTEITEDEKSDLDAHVESFVTRYQYDPLDRKLHRVDNVGNTNWFFYDSRDNRVATLDAKGNVVRYEYDGLNRPLATTRLLTDTGDGSGTVVDEITTRQEWDDSHRLVAQVDDNTNATRYVYDALNRRTRLVYADGTGQTNAYDARDNVISRTDANGTMVQSSYDLLDRTVTNQVNRAPGVLGTTFERYQYDGLSRLVHAEDNDSLVMRRHDSLSRVTQETQQLLDPPSASRLVGSVYDGVGNKLSCAYPGGRNIACTYDETERLDTVSDSSGLIARYNYVGPDRVIRREYGNGTRTDYTYDGLVNPPNAAGDFSVRKMIAVRHTRVADTNVLDEHTFTWDRTGNKTQRKDVRIGGPLLTHDYSYDSTYRLGHTLVTGAFSNTVRETTYGLDGVGNRTTVVGAPDPGQYVMTNNQPEPADFQMNQYTATTFDAREYDRNGNLTRLAGAAPPRNVTYDYRNLMVEYTNAATGQRHLYAYDALGRRIRKVVDADGPAPTETRFYLDGWREIEEQDDLGATLATYAYGSYIDEVLDMERDDGGTPTRSFYHADDRFNIRSLSNTNGQVIERYEYADYGAPTILDPSGVVLLQSTVGNPHRFTGRRYDEEIGWYYCRRRFMDPAAGRFTTRDAIGIWGDPLDAGNGYGYAANNPFSRLDPFGYQSGDDQGGVFDQLEQAKAELSHAKEVVKELADSKKLEDAVEKIEEMEQIIDAVRLKLESDNRDDTDPLTGDELDQLQPLIDFLETLDLTGLTQSGYWGAMKEAITGASGGLKEIKRIKDQKKAASKYDEAVEGDPDMKKAGKTQEEINRADGTDENAPEGGEDETTENDVKDHEDTPQSGEEQCNGPGILDLLFGFLGSWSDIWRKLD